MAVLGEPDFGEVGIEYVIEWLVALMKNLPPERVMILVRRGGEQDIRLRQCCS